jgi:hypothetical protein
VIEILTFRLREGVEPTSFRHLDTQIQTEVAYQQPGLLRRTSGRNADGRWLILYAWASADAAAAGRAALDASPLGAQLASMIDSDTVHLERFEGLD